MCLGVPGRVTSLETTEGGMLMAAVDFAGISKRVCMAYVPEAKVGDYVIVHVGFALSLVDEEEAQFVFKTLRELGELGELEIPQPDEQADLDAGPRGPGA